MIEYLADDLACIFYEKVACTVALLIVDLLKAVDIADYDGKFKFITAPAFDLLICLVLDVNIRMLVLDARQRISVSHIYRRTDLGLVLHLSALSFIDILDCHDDMVGILGRAKYDEGYELRTVVEHKPVIDIELICLIELI